MISEHDDEEIQELGRLLYIKKNSKNEMEFKDVLNKLMIFFIAPEKVGEYEAEEIQLSKKAPETLQLIFENIMKNETSSFKLNIEKLTEEFTIRNYWSNKEVLFKYDSFRKKDLDAFIKLGLISRPIARDVLFNDQKKEACKNYFLYIKSVLNAKNMKELSSIKSFYERFSRRQLILLKTLKDAKKAIKQEPSLRNISKVASTYFWLKKYDKALKILEKLVKQYPENPGAWNLKGLILENMGELDQALYCYEEAIKLDPEAYWQKFNKGNILMAQEKYQEAIDHFNELEKQFPEDNGIPINKGVSYRELGQFDEAVASLEVALKLDPINSYALLTMGTIKREQKYFEESLYYFNQLLNKFTTDLETKYYLGRTLQDLMRDQEAILYLEYVKSKKPNFLEAWYYLGISYAKLFQVNAAMNCWNTILTIDPKHLDALVMKGRGLCHYKDWKNAEKCFREVLIQDDKNIKAYEGLIKSLRGLEKYKDAETYLNKLVELDPDNQFALNLTISPVNDEIIASRKKDNDDYLELPEILHYSGSRRISEEEMREICRLKKCYLCPMKPFCRQNW